MHMWLDESVTRSKGEGGADYCRDPKAKRGQGELVHIHWLETLMYVVQEKIQSAAELKFNTTAYVFILEYFRFSKSCRNSTKLTPRFFIFGRYSGVNTAYSDGIPRASFPPRPAVKERCKKGGGIDKKVSLLKPFNVKEKGRDQCLYHWHLEWDLLCAALYQWRVAKLEEEQKLLAYAFAHCTNQGKFNKFNSND